ncbi:MAG: 2-(1,2-epoxy-1,2-dihydrophenyl)acetyl-CoA isomerase PaaG [Pseudomonadales bacterium]|nr:2-(1,2-epoxy-1,2-dihydrophenyl)acetyl-CoA isomerase PaaG [Pseudomonadales bacterium]
MSNTIQYEVNKSIACITLNRPDKLNSFNVEMHTELQQVMQKVESDDNVRCVIITGAGRGFCAGQDLSDRAVKSEGTEQSEPVDLGASVEKFYNPLIRRISQLDKPGICALNGVAAGAGASIALACDFVIASNKASFILAFCAVGLVPDSAASWHMIRSLGLARTKALALLGNKLSAEKALQWGLIWQVSEPEQLLQDAWALAGQLADKPPLAIAATKHLINSSFDKVMHQQLEEERLLMKSLARTYDYQEGVAAFMEKRPGHFKGC